jgi:hypothetical protein
MGITNCNNATELRYRKGKYLYEVRYKLENEIRRKLQYVRERRFLLVRTVCSKRIAELEIVILQAAKRKKKLYTENSAD